MRLLRSTKAQPIFGRVSAVALRISSVITSSTGNHGLGVAAAAKFLGLDAEVFLCAQVTQAKQGKIRSHGARVRVVGDDCMGLRIENAGSDENKRLQEFLLPLILSA